MTKYKGSNGVSPNFKNIPTKITPVINSTIGYCQDILLLHFKHFPPSIRKLKSGISSYQCKSLLQEKHLDFPVIKERLVLYLKATTFKKLPIIVPKTKIINKLTNSIIIYPRKFLPIKIVCFDITSNTIKLLLYGIMILFLYNF